MDGFTFSVPVRVRFADTDAQGIAHNSAYLVWFEVARVEYLRAFAGGYQSLRDHGIEAIVLESLCRYRIPVRFDDELVVRARLRRRDDAAADARAGLARRRDPRRRSRLALRREDLARDHEPLDLRRPL